MNARRACPICLEEGQVIFSRPFRDPALRSMVERLPGTLRTSDHSYEIRRCSSCELHYQTWVLDASEAAAWYAAAPQNDDFWAEIGKQKLHWFAHMTEEILILRQLIAASPPHVLDFGCNWGKWASVALAHGCRVDAVEINPKAASFCAQRGITILPLTALNPSQYDFINVDQVAEHLSDPREVITQLAQSLKPGGFLKLSTPENRALPSRLANDQNVDATPLLNPIDLDPLAPLEHVNLFTHRSLKRLAATAGLQPFRIPVLLSLGAGQLWNLPRQLNRNLITPFKRWTSRRTYQWFSKPRRT